MARPTTIPEKPLTTSEIRMGKLLALDPMWRRPRVRGDCVDGDRPCPWVGCQHHLYLDVLETGSLKINFPDSDPAELEQTCALDVADRGGATLEEVGQVMNLTRERCRQIEAKALIQLHRKMQQVGIDSAEGFLHAFHPLAGAMEEEGGQVQVGAGDVRRAAAAFNRQAAEKAGHGEQTRRICERPRPISERSRLFREQAAQVAERRKETKMRASKMDNLTGKAAKLVQKALIDRDIGAVELYDQLNEVGAVTKHDLTESGVGYYLRTRRAAIDAGHAEAPSDNGASAPETPQEEPEQVAALVPLPPVQVPEHGYVVLPGGQVWTRSVDAALELQQRIVAGRAKGG